MMRTIVAAALVAASIAGAAFAQNQAPLAFVPTWAAEPSSADYIRHYPPQALHRNVSGIAVLCCTPQADHSLDRAVSSEFPAGQGFGQASARVSRSYRLSQQSYDDVHTRGDTPVRISVLWGAPIPAPGAIDELSRIDRETAHACLPPLQ